jgi:spermidine/putrescine-binding protein
MNMRMLSTSLSILAGAVTLILTSPAGAEAAPRVSPAAGTTSTAASLSATRYGAIAHSPSTLNWGWAVNYDSQGVARGAAYYQCSTRANDCQVDAAVTNSWAALALSTRNGPWGAGWGPTRTDAVNNADYYCRHYGGGDQCHIVVAIDATYIP